MNYIAIAVCFSLVQLCIAQDGTAKIWPFESFRIRLNKAEIEALQHENVVLFPNVVLRTVLNAWFGSTGNTRKEITDALGPFIPLPGSELASDELLKSKVYYETVSLFADPKIKPKLPFEEIILTGTDAPTSVNKWISDQSKEHIKQFYNASFDPRLAALLISAGYFESSWKDPFLPTETKEGLFYNGESKIKAYFMENDKLVPFYSTKRFQSFAIPYVQENLYFYIILPHENETVAELSDQLTVQDYEDVFSNSKPTQVFYKVPKFTLKSRSNLKNALQILGVSRSFMPIANFSKLTDNVIHIDDVTYESVINVLEAGTEAAGAVAIEMSTSSLTNPSNYTSTLPSKGADPKVTIPAAQKITVDRPFLYTIYDHRSHTSLLSGAVYSPQ